MMGLRLSNGIQRSRFHEELGQDLEALLPADRLAQLQDAGYLLIDEAGMRASETGILRLNALLAYLLA
jgi:oxygen-independent coproporphyrinogen-3 oxidase